MSKRRDGNWMLKWKNKLRVRLSALDKKKLVLTMLPYVLTALYADRASYLYRISPGEDIPIFAMTANAFLDDKRQSKEAGMNEHLSKPLDEKKLLNTIWKYTIGKNSNSRE